MKIAAVIPARMASSRLPGKPLRKICGLEMIEHVRRRVCMARFIDFTAVATCDKVIYDLVKRNGGNAIMTSKKHKICTDRVAEAAKKIKSDIIINIQGDEPFIQPAMLKALIRPFYNKRTLCVNMIVPINSQKDFTDPNAVKVVFDKSYNALYFSREPIPSEKKYNSNIYPKFRQTGFIAFKRSFLFKFLKLKPVLLEKIESVDMLRALEHDFKIRLVKWPRATHDVDTKQDLIIANRLMKKDKLYKLYKETVK